ncbi:MAG TPA: FlgD immunoglobulin-like domain containing protein, partial [Candidatus Edwardsbacteria bacterium]|nr:FlgD immunoglobulin-like domain containing protein [Candidatus Edwardsbacteria bacterium]
GNKDYPAVCHGDGGKSLVIYSGWTDTINGEYANAMRMWGVFIDDTLGVAGKIERNHIGLHTLLMQNSPNPFNTSTNINYQLSAPEKAILAVYNINGQLVKTIVNHDQPAGFYTVKWDGRNESNELVSSGIYLYRLHAGSITQIKKLILVR